MPGWPGSPACPRSRSLRFPWGFHRGSRRTPGIRPSRRRSVRSAPRCSRPRQGCASCRRANPMPAQTDGRQFGAGGGGGLNARPPPAALSAWESPDQPASVSLWIDVIPQCRRRRFPCVNHSEALREHVFRFENRQRGQRDPPRHRSCHTTLDPRQADHGPHCQEPDAWSPRASRALRFK